MRFKWVLYWFMVDSFRWNRFGSFSLSQIPVNKVCLSRLTASTMASEKATLQVVGGIVIVLSVVNLYFGFTKNRENCYYRTLFNLWTCATYCLKLKKKLKIGSFFGLGWCLLLLESYSSRDLSNRVKSKHVVQAARQEAGGEAGGRIRWSAFTKNENRF